MGIDYLQCSVCLSSKSKDDAWTVLPCGHYLHFSCCQQWLGHSRRCPSCRARVTHDGDLITLYNVCTLESGEEHSLVETQQELRTPAAPSGSAGVREAQALKQELRSLQTELGQAEDRLEEEKGRFRSLQEHNRDCEEHAARLQEKLSDKDKRADAAQQEISELRLRLRVADSKLLERRLDASDPSLVSDEELQREMQKILGRKEAQGEANRMLMRSVVSSKKRFQQLDVQYRQDIEALKKQLRAEKQRAADGKRALQERLEKLQQEVESLRQQRGGGQGAESRGAAAAAPASAGTGMAPLLADSVQPWADGSSSDLEVVGDDEPQVPTRRGNVASKALEAEGLAGPASRPSFTVRPGAGVRPPAMSASASLILQGADGRGGRVTTAARRVAPASSASLLARAKMQHQRPPPQASKMSSHCPLASLKAPPQPLADKTNIMRGGRLVLPPAPKRPKGNLIKAAASKDIADYFGRG